MPLLCCILATKDRPHFLARAIAYYWQQTLTDTELIIVDDGAESCEAHVPRTPDITYLRLREKTSLGAKLNLGIEATSGRIIQKLDDDYYHPYFLKIMVSALQASGRRDVVAAVERLLVLLSATGDLVDAGGGWFAGGTYCFHREAWERHPFRDVPGRGDVGFLETIPISPGCRCRCPVIAGCDLGVGVALTSRIKEKISGRWSADSDRKASPRRPSLPRFP